MNGQVCTQSISSPGGSPASHFPWLESKKVKGTNVTYGRKCSELSTKLRRVGWWVKTFLESCELPLPTLSRTWSVKATTSSCLILKLRLSERRTEESASRLWPNVTTARDYKNGTAKLFPTPSVGAGLCGGTGNFQQLKALSECGVITEEERKSMSAGNGGCLNPAWVEWLMGYPIGWTEV